MNKYIANKALDLVSILLIILISVPLAVFIGLCWLLASAFQRIFGKVEYR